jgi:predicted nucleic acid-binding protein
MIAFADTSALFALLARDDRMHRRARKNFLHFQRHKAELATSSYILVETMALLQHRIGVGPVHDFHARIYPLLDVVWVEESWHAKAYQRLASMNQRSLSFVDCLSFEIMEVRDIRIAFAFDRHFEENGFIIADYE